MHLALIKKLQIHINYMIWSRWFLFEHIFFDNIFNNKSKITQLGCHQRPEICYYSAILSLSRLHHRKKHFNITNGFRVQFSQQSLPHLKIIYKIQTVHIPWVSTFHFRLLQILVKSQIFHNICHEVATNVSYLHNSFSYF